MSVYFYFIDGLLIDTGSYNFRSISVIKKLDIKQVAITHLHRDHCGMVPWISRNYQVPIYFYDGKEHNVTVSHVLFNEHRAVSCAKPYPDVIQTTNFEFLPIFTPGHTADHICLYEPEQGWLFTGDLYVTPQPKVCLRTESIAQYISSLKRVIKLDFQTVFCAHQGVIKNGHQALMNKLEYLEMVQFEAKQLYEAGYDTRMITKTLFPKKARLELLTLGAFSSTHFVRSCLNEHVD